MRIDLSFDASTAAAPTGFKTDIQDAANILDSLITNNITVTIDVGYGEVGGQPLASTSLAEGGPVGGGFVSPSEMISLLATQGDATAKAEAAALPANAASQLPSEIYLAPTQEQALGLLPSSLNVVEGEIGFSSTANYALNPNDQAVPGEYGIIPAALHELTHALGRTLPDAAMELTRFTAPGTLASSMSGPAYFSLNGGQTALAQFDPTGTDSSDWAGGNAAHDDAFALVSDPDTSAGITAVDKQMLSALGFDVGTTPTSRSSDTPALTVSDFPPASVDTGLAAAEADLPSIGFQSPDLGWEQQPWTFSPHRWA